jgi:RHS repeat-associated protein
MVMVCNKSLVPVYFDDLQVRHDRGRILEENHYYAYGLKIAALSSKAFGGAPNNYQYQGDYSEFDDDLGWNDFMLRSYDPQIGRFLQWVPYDQFASGYVGMGNDPGNNVDPTGGWGDPISTLDMVTVVGKAKTGSSALSLGTKLIATTATTLKAVTLTYNIYQNAIGEQFETKNLSLGDNISDGGQDWNKVGTGTRTVYVEQPTTDILSPGEWQQRLAYFYRASHVLPDGSTEDDWWDFAEQTWNGAHATPFGNVKYTNNSFWTGGREEISVAPTAVQPSDSPVEFFIGGGAKFAVTALIRNGSAKGISVIGPRATYRQFGKAFGANFLDVTDDAWSWSINKKFLRSVVKRGDDVMFAGQFNPAKLDPNSILAREIKFLVKRGYKWNKEFSILSKKP